MEEDDGFGVLAAGSLVKSVAETVRVAGVSTGVATVVSGVCAIARVRAVVSEAGTVSETRAVAESVTVSVSAQSTVVAVAGQSRVAGVSVAESTVTDSALLGHLRLLSTVDGGDGQDEEQSNLSGTREKMGDQLVTKDPANDVATTLTSWRHLRRTS